LGVKYALFVDKDREEEEEPENYFEQLFNPKPKDDDEDKRVFDDGTISYYNLALEYKAKKGKMVNKM